MVIGIVCVFLFSRRLRSSQSLSLYFTNSIYWALFGLVWPLNIPPTHGFGTSHRQVPPSTRRPPCALHWQQHYNLLPSFCAPRRFTAGTSCCWTKKNNNVRIRKINDLRLTTWFHLAHIRAHTCACERNILLNILTVEIKTPPASPRSRSVFLEGVRVDWWEHAYKSTLKQATNSPTPCYGRGWRCEGNKLVPLGGSIDWICNKSLINLPAEINNKPNGGRSRKTNQQQQPCGMRCWSFGELGTRVQRSTEKTYDLQNSFYSKK